ncbi:TIGR01620 family protein [Microvirga aerilata]|uniref:TIGR01620 family protein n=1 Tax=Microvirga aerilata TaxID=670292 RepID=A0A937D0D7_9HYPH|nr:TIGR01620 family protein [Microvirga aerilata]MBL0402915.1 TIGR01620 family protein [Microvirga aerilata]
MSRQPRAYRLDDPNVAAGAVQVTEEPFDAIEAADGVVVPMGEKRRAPWLGILLSALSGLVLLGLGLAVESLIVDLYRIAPWLGWVALALAVLAVLAFLAIIGREVSGIWREQKIESLREAAIDALAVKDHKAAKSIVSDLLSLYGGRAAAAQGSARLRGLTDEIIDADDRLAIAERELLAPLDAQAKRAIAGAAKQVSLVTAVSPRAIVDVAFVIFAAVRLLRTLSRIYGGRPGLFGFLRLAKAAFNHLAITGGMAVGDSLMQQVLGLGLAARISAKLGEGVLNGLMTARFGLAALSVCRPLPFIREETPKIGDVAGELISRAEAVAAQ